MADMGRVQSKSFKLRVILDFNKNIYDNKIRVNFIKRIRDELKFSNVDDLSLQDRALEPDGPGSHGGAPPRARR